jgi:hypothetical protein
MCQMSTDRPHGPRRCGGPEHHGVSLSHGAKLGPTSSASMGKVVQVWLKINSFLTNAAESMKQGKYPPLETRPL